GAFVLASLALMLGIAMLPRGDELLLIHVKNRDIARARELLAAARDSVSTAASVVALDELFLLEGRVDEAIAETEAYAEARPDDAEAWIRLTRMYADAQRLDDQIRALSHVYRLEPSTPRARQLAILYRWTGDETAESNVLHDLVRDDQASAAEALRSARLDASLGRPERAYDTLERLRVQQPASFDYAAVELYASLIVDLRGTDRLALPLRLLPVVQTEPEVLLQLARTLNTWGRPDAAVALFDTPPGAEAPPARLAMRARVATGTSEASRVARELAARDAAQPLAPEPLAALVDLSLSLGDYETVESLLGNPAHSVEPATITVAISHAIAHDARAQAQAIIARAGDAGLSESPMLALDLAVERGDVDGAERWIGLLDHSPDTTPDEEAAVAQFESRLGFKDRAFSRLAALTESGVAPEWVANDLAALAVDVGRADEALALLSSSGSPADRSAWARLAVTTGKSDLVEAWLMSEAVRKRDAQPLSDAYYLLADRGDAFRATIAAQRLFDVRGTDGDAVILGQALTASGRSSEALVPLRRTSPANVDATRVYDAALVAAQNAGADVATELRTVFHERLRDADLPQEHRQLLVEGLWAAGDRASLFDEIVPLARQDLDRWLSSLVESARAAEERDRAVEIVAAALNESEAGEGGEFPVSGVRDPASAVGDPVSGVRRPGSVVDQRQVNFVRALMELDAPDDVLLPQLRRMAYEAGENWVYAYDERLALRSMTAERVELWTTIGRAREVPADVRRAAASRLVDLGAPEPAADVFEDLAASSGPADPDLQQLLYLWGPHAGERQVAWLVQRLLTASPSDQPAWMGHIVQAGGARSVVSAVPRLREDVSPAFVDAWLSAHEANADRVLLESALEQVLHLPDASPQALRHVGRAALANDFSSLATDAFGRIASLEPDDRESLRWLGVLAFYEGRVEPARKWLNAYVAAGGDEPEPLYQLGELAREDGDSDLARSFFVDALERLDDPAAVVVNRPLLANVLVRLDDRDRSSEIFESMLEADPSLDHVRADFVVALLQWGEYPRARLVLEGTAPRREAENDAAADGSGARRLDLLRVQWLTHEGRYADALRVLESLSERFPSDPDVLVARGSFDADRGRPVDADLGFALARRAAPGRADIDRLVQERTRQQSPRAGIETETRTITDGWDERSQQATVGGHFRPHAPVTLSI
ncbi:MAG: hypothetical protein OEW19_09615, partial [Acidobacteriota bacterium]|nr:hypothetical protein [Acidobacteriota bacterium]